MAREEILSRARELFAGGDGRPRLGLAPMAGVTDLPFRLLCREMGADFAVSEMISAKGFLLNRKPGDSVRALYTVAPYETVGIQLFGSEPELVAQAASELAARGCAFIDINMGCPMPKITGNGEGSALMRTPRLAAEIVRQAAGAIDVPLTVKMRAGWDDTSVNAVELACLAEENGAAAVCVHGRTREQYYAGRADWSVIARVKRAVSIPVMGNGDVTGPEDARRMLEETGCDGIMIGRGAQGDPFIFGRIRAALSGGAQAQPGPRDILETIRRHTDMLAAWRGENVAVREMRKHIAWYLHGLRGSAQVRAGLLTQTDPAEIDRRLEDYLLGL